MPKLRGDTSYTHGCRNAGWRNTAKLVGVKGGEVVGGQPIDHLLIGTPGFRIDSQQWFKDLVDYLEVRGSCRLIRVERVRVLRDASSDQVRITAPRSVDRVHGSVAWKLARVQQRPEPSLSTVTLLDHETRVGTLACLLPVPTVELSELLDVTVHCNAYRKIVSSQCCILEDSS